MSEADWLAGNRAAYRDILSRCLSHVADGTKSHGKLVIELAETREALRELWDELGVGHELTDKLYLPDVVRVILKRLDDVR